MLPIIPTHSRSVQEDQLTKTIQNCYKRRRAKLFGIVVICVAALFSCSKDRSSSPGSAFEDSTEPAVFSVCPVAIEKITDLEPLGAMNPSGHTVPTDHVYFYTSWTYGEQPIYPPELLPVYAPGTGVVTWLLQGQGRDEDAKIMIRMNTWVHYYLDHVVLDSGIAVGSILTAGQQVGTTKGIAIDLGVTSDLVTLPGFVNPARYEGQTLHTDSPFKYFSEPLRSQLYALVRRNAPDKDGRIDYDISGKLIGNWFHESVPVSESMMPPAWPKQLAFCPDSNEPSELRISIGGTVCPAGKFKPSPEDPPFDEVGVSAGAVTYHLSYTESGYCGIMMVQLIDSTHLKVEVFPDAVGEGLPFTANAKIYTR